jgi:UPF0271 protein
MSVDLNSDLGEGGAHDEALLEVVTSANVACGFHAGDPALMSRTVRLAAKKGVAIGAHPGFRDPEHFGRREQAVSPDEAFDLMLYQIGALQAVAAAQGARVRHVKPHGALYNQAARDPALADALARAVRAADPNLVFVGLAGSEMTKAARRLGLRAAEEGFADRGYGADGMLIPRSQPGALVEDPDEAARRGVRMAKEGKADTLCVHGDTPGALEMARRLRDALRREGIEVRAP